MRNRNIDLHFRLSEKEFDELERKREKAGLAREAFIRAAILGALIKAPPSLDFIKYHRELRRIGSNIDQVLRLANTKRFVDVPLLKRSLTELHETQRHLWDEFAKR